MDTTLRRCCTTWKVCSEPHSILVWSPHRLSDSSGPVNSADHEAAWLRGAGNTQLTQFLEAPDRQSRLLSLCRNLIRSAGASVRLTVRRPTFDPTKQAGVGLLLNITQNGVILSLSHSATIFYPLVSLSSLRLKVCILFTRCLWLGSRPRALQNEKGALTLGMRSWRLGTEY